MNNALYVGLSRQETLQRALEIAANNIANADTAGFKLESLLVQTEPGSAPSTPDARPVAYVLDHGVTRDFTQGAMEGTGNPYDLSVEGLGFFQIQTANGMRYTRDGRFTVDNKNQLVTKAGDPVMDAGGRPIVLDPTKPEPAIAQDGTISQGGTPGAKLGVYRFPDLAQLQKVGGNLFEAPAAMTPTVAADGVVRQGTVEKSNVQPVLEITNLIEISRAYERVAQMMSQQNDLSSQAISRLGKAA
ncbi:MAG TPA: flagellar basal-body rod protein FlgF [Caulobacteraceae bacterium]|jgi:flagellar basal-body rod protein FlgF|nr:flagellar basal-body rod protein FlgF [Caulobacteraceae bacterium]